jgi:hypothetical protein
MTCDMRPAFRRGWEGEGKPNRCPGAGQRAKPATRGPLFCFGKREGKALGVPTNREWRRSASRSRNAAKQRHPCTVRRRRAVWRQAKRGQGCCPERAAPQSPRTRIRRPTGKDRGKSASGSAKRLRTLKERSGKECDPRKSRSSSHAPDRNRNGQDLGLGARSA